VTGGKEPGKLFSDLAGGKTIPAGFETGGTDQGLVIIRENRLDELEATQRESNPSQQISEASHGHARR